MRIQIVFPRGGVVAVRALEWLHTVMDGGAVLSEIASTREPLSAFTTFERLLTRMHNFVPH